MGPMLGSRAVQWSPILVVGTGSLYFCQIVKRDRKSYIINISKEYSIVSQFTSFVAIEEREKVSRGQEWSVF